MTIATGLAVGLKEIGIEFEPDKPFVCCVICGAIRQTPHDRTNKNVLWGLRNRRAWAEKHRKLHSEREHRQLRNSGLSMTPEAAKKLAAFGVIPVMDMVMNEETAVALLESSPIPTDDAEC